MERPRAWRSPPRRAGPESETESKRRSGAVLTEVEGPAIPLRRRSMLVPFTDSRAAWLLLRTKPKQKHNVVQVLHHRALGAQCPHGLEPRRHAHGPFGPVPLFPSDVLARCAASSQYTAASYCSGAFGVVRFGEFLAAVEDAFVDRLRSRGSERVYLAAREVRKQPVGGSGTHVLAGPFAGYEGLVKRYMPAIDRVRLLLMLVGGGRRVEVEAHQAKCA